MKFQYANRGRWCTYIGSWVDMTSVRVALICCHTDQGVKTNRASVAIKVLSWKWNRHWQFQYLPWHLEWHYNKLNWLYFYVLGTTIRQSKYSHFHSHSPIMEAPLAIAPETVAVLSWLLGLHGNFIVEPCCCTTQGTATIQIPRIITVTRAVFTVIVLTLALWSVC